MKALRLNNNGVEVLEIDHNSGSIDKDIASLDVLKCGVCRTDAKLIVKGHRDLKLPRIPGHEICGYDPITNKRYVVWPGVVCGHCEFCKKGAENLCPEMKIIGFHLDGGFAEKVNIPKYSLIEIPDDLPSDLATFAEPLACVINGCEKLLVFHSSCTIIGGGTIGLMAYIYCVSIGLDVKIKEIDSSKRAKIMELDVFKDNNIFASEDRKSDCGINASSTVEAFYSLQNSVKSGGDLIFFSGISEEKNIDTKMLNEIHYREQLLKGAYGCTKTQMVKAVAFINNQRSFFLSLIEEQIKLNQVPNIIKKLLSNKNFKYIVDFKR